MEDGCPADYGVEKRGQPYFAIVPDQRATSATPWLHL
jgi:hypothetical protein